MTPEQLEYVSLCFGSDFDMVENMESKKLLQAAFDAVPGISYRCVLQGGDDFHPECTVVFYRWVDSDGFVLKRAEVTYNNNIKEVFIQNKDGRFGTRDNDSREILEVSLLSQPDLISTPLNSADMLYYAYTMEPAHYQGRACTKITGRLSQNPDDWQSVAIVSPAQIQDRKSEFFSVRPFIREYLIDSRSLLIYSRTDYNSRKKKIFHATLGKVEPEYRPELSLFATPRNIKGRVAFRHEFEEQQEESEPATGSPFVESCYNRSVDYLFAYGGYFFAILGALSVGMIGYLKIAEKKHTH